MAKVTDIQDKNGVSKEVQDKDLSRQTAATAIASTDYVMLQDTSGGYHKIAKASFTEAVRSALGSVINSTAKGTNIAKVPVLDSNNDLGMGSLANLASVLGDAVSKGILNVNANTLHGSFGMVETYLVSSNGTELGLPGNYGFLRITKASSWTYQEFLMANYYYTRHCERPDSDNTWTNWRGTPMT